MNNIFLWFKLSNNINPVEKSRISATIHNFLFIDLNAKKLNKGSNAFLLKTDWNESELSNEIVKISNTNIKLIVININDRNYQGWLTKDDWKIIGEC